MYKEKKGIGVIASALIAIFISITSIILYDMYIKIDINPQGQTSKNNVTIERTAATITTQTEENQNTNDVIENVSKAVVGISKIRDVGNSIFGLDGAKELGLGTGVIVSNNGYIVTNQHVAGNRYSTCYVTTEDGQTYNGTVTWADSDIDIAIVKINITNSPYSEIGDSDSVRPRRKSICNRQSNWI